MVIMNVNTYTLPCNEMLQGIEECEETNKGCGLKIQRTTLVIKHISKFSSDRIN